MERDSDWRHRILRCRYNHAGEEDIWDDAIIHLRDVPEENALTLLRENELNRALEFRFNSRISSLFYDASSSPGFIKWEPFTQELESKENLESVKYLELRKCMCCLCSAIISSRLSNAIQMFDLSAFAKSIFPATTLQTRLSLTWIPRRI